MRGVGWDGVVLVLVLLLRLLQWGRGRGREEEVGDMLGWGGWAWMERGHDDAVVAIGWVTFGWVTW